ncbi:hypothetical protein [Streptomyces pseudovenezuelae]|uniref:hypothetical protein n=1 Tax=Streptomyces pseudovenezuelae TaxID=67350 RepID=UPI002E322DD5|nr:hypothetical protein [Streptomyces pseudovenezuelae]
MLIATDSRGHVLKHPSKPAIGAMLADLRPGDHVLLERQDEHREGDWYIQVWFRDETTYQLEFRNGVPAEHYQTLTTSQEQVSQALLGWAADEPDWQRGITWDNIGAMFGAPVAEDPDQSAL